MLIEEVEKRSQVRWTQTDVWPEQAAAIVLVGPAAFVDTSVQEHGLPDIRRSGFDGVEGSSIESHRCQATRRRRGRERFSRRLLFGVGRLRCASCGLP